MKYLITALAIATSIASIQAVNVNGDPTDINNFPACAINCSDQSSGLLSDPNDLSQICGVRYRTRTAVCEAAICSDLDRQSA
ncbi:MAG: hypothetical protein Q9186_000050 [Xanthomendoza sp. 1 TL-2023]